MHGCRKFQINPLLGGVTNPPVQVLGPLSRVVDLIHSNIDILTANLFCSFYSAPQQILFGILLRLVLFCHQIEAVTYRILLRALPTHMTGYKASDRSQESEVYISNSSKLLASFCSETRN